MRQEAAESEVFVQILEKLRIGVPDLEDWLYLKQNFIRSEDISSQSKIIKLFATNQDAKVYNYKQMLNSKEQIYFAEAIDSHPQLKHRKTDQFGNLEYNLFLLLNSPYYLTSNLNVRLGLANGTLGVLKDIIFKKVNDTFLPEVIIMEFQGLKNETATNPSLIAIQKITILNEYNMKETGHNFL
jgi:hypothetical protein